MIEAEWSLPRLNIEVFELFYLNLTFEIQIRMIPDNYN